MSKYEIKFGGSKKSVKSLAEASKLFQDWIDENYYGASDLSASDGHLYKNGKLFGYVSYNGRVWEGNQRDWKNSKEIFD